MEAGFTLLEIVLVVVVLAILARTLVQSSSSMSQVTSTGGAEGMLQMEGERILREVVGDLRRSGYVTLDGHDYPHVLVDGATDDAWFDRHEHPPAASEARAGDPDFGPNYEIIFRLPGDADGDGRPDLVDGEIQWSPAEISYTVLTGADGINRLMRRVELDDGRPVGTHVERIVFATTVEGPDDFDVVPKHCVRVQVFMRRRSENGSLYRGTYQTTVRLRNGPETL